MINTPKVVWQRIKDEFTIVIRYWSVWFTAASTGFLTWLSTAPDQAYAFWLSLPADVTRFVPERYLPMIGVTLWVAGFLSKFIKQRSVERARDAKELADATASISHNSGPDATIDPIRKT